MNTTESVSMVRGRRRSYSEEFKAEAVAACLQPGMSMAAVALSRGLNANLLRRWVVEAEQTGSVRVSARGGGPVESSSRFVPVPLVSVPAEPVIRIDAAWIAVEPLDMRSGVDTALARVVSVFGATRSHHAYLFLNRRTNRLKVLVHDGFGLWLCARRLQQGHFVRPDPHLGSRIELTSEQLRALVVGPPWQRLTENARISVL